MKMIFILLVVFQLKHFLADYIFQTQYMLGKSKTGWNFVPPLVAHAMVHAGMTLLIVGIIDPSPIIHSKAWLALVDFGAHFTMDRIKAGPRYLGRFKDTNKPQFWWALGFDQMIHHVTHYFIIWEIIR